MLLAGGAGLLLARKFIRFVLMYTSLDIWKGMNVLLYDLEVPVPAVFVGSYANGSCGFLCWRFLLDVRWIM